MKNSIKHLVYSLIGMWLVVITISCQSEQLPGNGPFDPNARIEASLGVINLSNDQEQGVTRAPAYTKLENGKDFRLYAFRRGEIEAPQIVVSYAYTMINGKPVMNAGQGDGKLYLPYGDLDIYLVGPLAIDSDELDGAGKPISLPIASPNGVAPRQGADLIASCTPVTVGYTGKNELRPNPLKHKMAKVKMRVNLSEKYAYMKRLVLTKVEVFNQHAGVGKFTFKADDGGVITPQLPDSISGGSVVREGTQIQVTTEGKDYFASFILFPRQVGYLRTEIEMDITSTTPTEQTHPYRMSGIIRNAPLLGGKQNLFFTEPVISADIVWRPALLPWNDQEPVAPPMGGDMVLYLDGRDAPEMIDGKRCWRDRSGNGNHAQILSTDIIYNKEKMCYEFPKATDLMQIPALGMIPDYTLEIVVENSEAHDASLLLFRNKEAAESDKARDLCVHIPVGTEVFFDSGLYMSQTATADNNGRISKEISPDPIYYHTFKTYYFTKETSTTDKLMAMGVNGVSQHSVSKKNALLHHQAFDINEIGGIKKGKVRSVRLYRKALSSTELKSNYNSDKTIYHEDPDVVQAGLMLSLDGKIAPYKGIGKGSGANLRPTGQWFWPDVSGNGRHARYVLFKENQFTRSTQGYIEHTGKGYRFNNLNNTDFSFMEILKSLGTNTSYTLEMVMNSDREGATVFHSGPNSQNTTSRSVGVYVPFGPIAGSTAKRIIFDGPRLQSNSSADNRITYTGPYVSTTFTSQVHHYAFVRDHQKTNMLTIDGEKIGSLVTNGTISDVPLLTPLEMKYSFIGNLMSGKNSNDDGSIKDPQASYSDLFVGEIYAIRLYNRALTPTEILQNSRADKTRYGY